MNTINIFLASSADLEKDRREFENFIGRQNKRLSAKGIFLHLDIWEDFIDAISRTRLQDEYNKKIQTADIFVMLFFTKVGMYTSEEFDKALERFKNANKPLIYTYFKNTDIKFSNLKREEANSVWDFQDKLKNLGHFQTMYENTDALKNHFREQLDDLFVSGLLNISPDHKEISVNPQIPKSLSAGQPSIPPGFVGRDLELADIKEKLEKYGMLLINAEGGMGKTTLAAKYLNENLDRYKYYAWLFCDNGITEQIKTLATPLNVDLTKYIYEDEQLLANKTAMQNLPKDCLLILDNANEPKHIETFQNHFGGLQWHILLTSRCQQVLSKENEYTLNHLEPKEAKALFITYHDEDTAEFTSLLDKFLAGIGYNTLMIELFSKNLHELSAIGETLAYALEQCREKGLFLGERSFEIKTAYTDNVHRKAATTDQVLEVLYDLTRLEDTERHLLVNIALLPAESHSLPLLIDVLTTGDKITFAKQVKALAQKGWLSTNTKSCRMSPVVQQIVLAKNKDRVAEDAAILISNLNKKLMNDGATLVDAKAYSQAEPFAELAKSVTGFLNNDRSETALLLLNTSNYYKSIGNFKVSLELLDKAIQFFEKADTEKYIICLTSFGSIHQQQGNFKKALELFERCNGLCIEMFKANPHNHSLKNRLAISYEKLGSIYQQQGDRKTALQFFEQFNNLSKELVEDNPQNESLKNWLAISYEKLGTIYQQEGDFIKALQLFEQFNDLCKKLIKGNPDNGSLKNWAAISYEKLGSFYQQQGDFMRARGFFEECNDLFKELYESYPHNESFKNWVAISYEKLGYIFQLQRDFNRSLQFFEQCNDLFKELFESNPYDESLNNWVAISYEKLGSLYSEMQQPERARHYFKQAEAIWIYLTKSVTEAVEFQNNLKRVRSLLENI